jgi:hypothetical protein
MRRTLLTAIFTGCLCAGAGLRADAAPVVFHSFGVPTIVADADDRFTNAHDVQGVVTSFDRFNMTLRVSGREYPVVLHQGTVIQPRGTTLAPSMIVNIQGYWQAGAFYANRIVVVRY